jgi:hypothetical protein
MQTVELSQRQSACPAELPEDYRLVGVERGHSLRVGKLTGGDTSWHESS